MCPSVVRAGSLLEKVSSNTSRIATAMFAIRGVLLSATIGSYVILHTYQPIIVMVVRNNRYHQHDHADEYKKECYVPCSLHPYFFIADKDRS